MTMKESGFIMSLASDGFTTSLASDVVYRVE